MSEPEELVKEKRRTPAPGYADGARRAAPLAVAVFAFGVAFGLLAGAAGFSVLATLVFSATAFAGSAQFAAVSVLSGGGTLVAVITIVLRAPILVVIVVAAVGAAATRALS